MQQSAKKKIAIVMGPMVFGGTEKALIEMLNVFDYERTDVTVFLQDGTGEMESLINSRARIRYWPEISPPQALKSDFRKGNIPRVFYTLFCRLMCRLHRDTWQINGWYGARCLPMIDDEMYDCAIAYHGTTPAVLVGALHRLHSKKKILWIHAHVICPRKYWHWFDKQYNKFHKIYCVSESMLEAFKEKFPFAGRKTTVFHNILDANVIKMSATAPTNESLLPYSIVTVGRLSTEKGQNMIPAVARMLLNDGYNIHWYIIGEGYLREQIQQESQKYDVEDCVILLGAKQNPYPYIKNCDIYVQTSLLEGWGLTIQEAKILGKPIVATPLPAMKEQLQDGVTGYLAEDITPEALYQKIKQLMDRPDLCDWVKRNLSTESCNSNTELQELYDFIEAP